jgi:hypothetical protein
MAEIFGSFGRVISGNTLGSSIGSLARQILSDKISRIYQAFKDETTYEGALIDATSAIAKLQALLANVAPDSQAAKDIQEYIDLVRQENRTRIVNKALNALALQDAGTRDYSSVIKTMQSVLSDPTITESEKQQIQAAMATQVRNAVQNAINQFNDGGSITWNGSTTNFDLGGNADSLTSLISNLQAQFPSMQQELGKSLDVARSAVIIKKAEFAYAALDTTKDSVKIQGTKDLIKAYQDAYDLLKNSPYDLSQTTEALNALQTVSDYKDRLDTLEKNAAIKYAQTYLNSGENKATEYWTALDALGTKFLGTTKQSYVANGNVWGIAANGDVNTLYDYVDALIAQNGGSTQFELNGKTYTLSRDQLFTEFSKSEKIYSDLSHFSAGNDAVGSDTQNALSKLHDNLALIVQRDEFSIEDKYDALKNTLSKKILMSGADPYSIKQAYQDFGNALQDLAGKYRGNVLFDDMMNEGVYYATGQYRGSEKDTFYSDQSGNQTVFNQKSERDWVAETYSTAVGINKSSLETYIDVYGNVVSRGLAGEAGMSIPTQYGAVTVPAWTATGIRIKDQITGQNNVYQIITIRDKFNKDVGFLAVVNAGRGDTIVGGKVIDAKSGSVQMFNSASLTEMLAKNGITLDNLGTKITALGKDIFVTLNETLAVKTVGSATTLTGLRTGTFNLPKETGISALDSAESAGAVAKFVKEIVDAGSLKEFQIANPFDFRAGERSDASLRVKDANGNWVDASRLFTPDIVNAIISEKEKEFYPTTDGPTTILGGRGNSRGTGRPFMPAGAATPVNKALMAEYSTGGAPLPVSRPVNKNITPLVKTAPAVSPISSQKPLAENAVTPLVKANIPAVTPLVPAASTVSPVAAISPAQASSLATFRAGERASASSATLGGFFRNSPFKIAL